MIDPSTSAQISIPLERIVWPRLLGAGGESEKLYEQELWIEVDVACDGERLTTRSIFSVTPMPERSIIVT